jgi:23S rRNA pseudouridine1911/1915/1917 synthase
LQNPPHATFLYRLFYHIQAQYATIEISFIMLSFYRRDYMEITVTAHQSGLNVHTLLHREYGLSSSLLTRLRRRPDGILCNGEPVFTTAIVHAGDHLTVAVEQETSPIVPIAMPLEICWEDDLLLVVNKPAGLAVHPSALTQETATLANGLAAYLGPICGFHPVSRLDRGTSGLMVVAKNGYGHALCQKLLHTAAFRREYLGICQGVPQPDHGIIDAPIGRDPASLLRRQVTPYGSPARSEYWVLDTVGNASLLRLRPLTGRTHQLRVHLASIGHPLLGDWLYGTEDRALIARPALHSHALWLTHPLTGEVIHVTAPLPADMQRLLKKEHIDENRIEASI